MRRRSVLIMSAWLAALPAAAGAQAPAAPPPDQAQQAPAAPPAPSTPSTPAAPPPPTEAYSYEAAGRRDPFINLLGTGVEFGASTTRGTGPAGMAVGEISMRGVIQSRGAFIAAIQGPDNRTYLVRSGDKLMDGVIKAVTADGLIIIQDVNDPLSVVKQREVHKRLRSLDEAKE